MEKDLKQQGFYYTKFHKGIFLDIAEVRRVRLCSFGLSKRQASVGLEALGLTSRVVHTKSIRLTTVMAEPCRVTIVTKMRDSCRERP